MSVWDWVLGVYARPGVPEACLELQDKHGLNTSYLLWSIWAEARDPDLLARAADVAHRWDETTLSPLRTVRRALKAPFPPVADHAREKLREEIKAAELRAERTLMETLSGLSKGPRGGVPALEALRAANAAWGQPAPDDALAKLACALHHNASADVDL